MLDKLPAGSRLTVRNLLEDMVLQNDTTALYKLIWIAGREDLNEWLAKQGYADTVVGTAQLPGARMARIPWLPEKNGSSATPPSTIR